MHASHWKTWQDIRFPAAEFFKFTDRAYMSTSKVISLTMTRSLEKHLEDKMTRIWSNTNIRTTVQFRHCLKCPHAVSLHCREHCSCEVTWSLSFTMIDQEMFMNCRTRYDMSVIKSLWTCCGRCKQLLHSMSISTSKLVANNLNTCSNKDDSTGWGVILTTHPHLVPGQKWIGAIPPLPLQRLHGMQWECFTIFFYCKPYGAWLLAILHILPESEVIPMKQSVFPPEILKHTAVHNILRWIPSPKHSKYNADTYDYSETGLYRNVSSWQHVDIDDIHDTRVPSKA
jgi:hypothetical protein